MVNKYLTIITTLLVATQIVRLIQNTYNLHMNEKLIKKQLEGIKDITDEDIQNQRDFYSLGIKYFQRKLQEVDDGK